MDEGHINTKTKVTFLFREYLVSKVKAVFKKPLFSIIPMPIKTIINILSGVKATKFDTVVLNIYLIPLNEANDVVLTRFLVKSPFVLTSLYVPSKPISDKNPLKQITNRIKKIYVIRGFSLILSLNLFI